MIEFRWATALLVRSPEGPEGVGVLTITDIECGPGFSDPPATDLRILLRGTWRDALDSARALTVALVVPIVWHVGGDVVPEDKAAEAAFIATQIAAHAATRERQDKLMALAGIADQRFNCGDHAHVPGNDETKH